jgi:hypothetical protein
LASDIKGEHSLRVFENRVLRRIFGPKRDEVTGGWRKLHNEKLQNFYSSPSIIRMIKSRRMRWTGHVGRMGKRGMHIGHWWESQKGRDHWEDQGVGGRTILKLILEREDGMDWIDLAQDRDQCRTLMNTVMNLRVP